jgi:hypothetical protein
MMSIAKTRLSNHVRLQGSVGYGVRELPAPADVVSA